MADVVKDDFTFRTKKCLTKKRARLHFSIKLLVAKECLKLAGPFLLREARWKMVFVRTAGVLR